MTIRKSSVDTILFVDNATDEKQAPLRLADVQAGVGHHAGKFEYFHLDLDNPGPCQEKFRERLLQELQGRKGVMVITSCPAGVKGEILEITRRIESEVGYGARKVMISCMHGAQINSGFKARGLERDDFRHVRYYSEDPRRHIDKLDGLF